MRGIVPAEAICYTPNRLVKPPQMIAVPTAWDEMELGLESIVRDFCPKTLTALEFGVQHGYSLVALSNYFDHVIGVDTCVGDEHAGVHYDIYDIVKKDLESFMNIEFHKATWEHWADSHETSHYNLIHVDIFHTWKDTFTCGLWAERHADCVIFHDTISFPEVKLAVGHIATLTGRKFFHWPHRHGLGILV